MNYSGSRLSRSRSSVSAVTDVAFTPSPLIHIPISSPKEVWSTSLPANFYSNEILVLHFELFEPVNLVSQCGRKISMYVVDVP